MSRKNFTNNLVFKPILDRLLSVPGLKNQAKIAESIGIKEQAITNYKNKNQWPIETLYKLSVRHDLSLDWLLTGKNPQNAVAAAVTGAPTKNYADILRMTAEIMESGTVYAEALKSNVIAFHRAVVREALPVMETAMEQRIKQIIEQELRVIKGSGGPPGEWPGGTSRKDKAVTDEPPEGPELGKMGM